MTGTVPRNIPAEITETNESKTHADNEDRHRNTYIHKPGGTPDILPGQDDPYSNMTADDPGMAVDQGGGDTSDEQTAGGVETVHAVIEGDSKRRTYVNGQQVADMTDNSNHPNPHTESDGEEPIYNNDPESGTHSDKKDAVYVNQMNMGKGLAGEAHQYGNIGDGNKDDPVYTNIPSSQDNSVKTSSPSTATDPSPICYDEDDIYVNTGAANGHEGEEYKYSNSSPSIPADNISELKHTDDDEDDLYVN